MGKITSTFKKASMGTVLSTYRGQLLQIAVKAEKEGKPVSEEELVRGLKSDWEKLHGVYSKVGVTLDALIEMGKEVLQEAKTIQEAPELPKIVQTVVKAVEKIRRNDRCPCGSGLKYKKCCGKGS